MSKEEKMKAIEARSQAYLEKSARNLESALTKAENGHQEALQELKEKLKEQEKEAEETLQRYKDEAKTFLLAQVEAKDKTLDEAKALAKKSQDALKDQQEVSVFCQCRFFPRYALY